MEVTIHDVISKRKQRWTERHDIEFDRVLVRASVIKILETPALRDEIVAKPYLLIPIPGNTLSRSGRKTV